MISLSASAVTLISDLGYTFPIGITSLVSPGDLFTVEDIRTSNDIEVALTGGTINIIDENNVKLTSVKNIGLGDVSSGQAVIKNAIFTNLTATTMSASTVMINGVVAQVTDTFVTGATLDVMVLELERNGGLSDITVDLSSISSGSVFGSNYYTAQNLNIQTTVSESYVNALTFTTNSIPSGTYRVSWSYEWRGDTREDFEARVTVDGSEIMEVNMEAKDNSNYHGVSGFRNVNFGSSGTHVVNFDFATENSSKTMRIRNLILDFWRVI